MADSVCTLGVDMRSRVKCLGAKKNEKKEVQRELLAHQEEIPEEKMVVKKLFERVWCQRERGSLFMEAFGVEVEEELSASQTWAEGTWIGKWHLEQKEAWINQVFESQMWRQVRGLVGAVTCETRDLVKRHKKRGLKKSIEMMQGSYFWKEVGCRKDSSILVGQMKVSAKHVTGLIIAENGMR